SLDRAPPPAPYPPSLHDALPICRPSRSRRSIAPWVAGASAAAAASTPDLVGAGLRRAVGRSGARDELDIGGLLVHTFRRAPHARSEEHTSELQSRENLVCRRLLE